MGEFWFELTPQEAEVVRPYREGLDEEEVARLLGLPVEEVYERLRDLLRHFPLDGPTYV